MNLWPHQAVAIDRVLDAIKRGVPSGLICSPTGSGKTRLFCELARRLDWPVLVMNHTAELIQQTEAEFAEVWPNATIGIVKGPRDEWRNYDVVIASVQSLKNGRLERMPRDRFGLLICDEAHHSPAQSWSNIIRHFSSRFLLGLSATPERLDGQGLDELFGPEPLFVYELRDAVQDGRLVRPLQYAIETSADLSGVGFRAGDLAQGELSNAVNTESRNRVVVEAFLKFASSRRAVAFCAGIAHAIDLATAFRKAGIAAAHVTGETPAIERVQLLGDFDSGDIQVMTNCGILLEGYDNRELSCVMMARPTASRALYQQAVGRGLRLYPGKVNCLIFDFVDASRHTLMSMMSLLGAPQATSAKGADVLEAVDRDIRVAEEAEVIARTEVLAWKLERVCPWPDMPTLKGYAPSWAWQWTPATDKQLALLKRLGLSVGRDVSKGECSFLIDRALQLEIRFPAPATDKQEWFLRHHGAWVDGTNKRDASKLIGELKSRQVA